MATPYLSLFLVLLFLCSSCLLYLSLLSDSLSSSSSRPLPPPSPSCGLGRSWAVRLHSPAAAASQPGRQNLDVVADKVAEEVGLENRGQIGQLEGHYLLCASKPWLGATPLEDKWLHPGELLAAHPQVLWHSQDRHNNQSKGMDINVTGLWERNITGSGVTVVVVDDGNHHGTRCAGEIAAVSNNSFCAVGVAYGSKVAGIRVLDGPLTDSMEAVAFNKHYQVNDIYSCSWGPDDDGHTVDGPHPLGKHGVIAGRRGFGSVFVVASGNGGQYNDNCNYDGYANSIYTITIGAVDEMGKMPFYAEECASMLAVTSDWSMRDGTGCTDGHTGTSAAAPLAAGMVALMLQVRPCLTWRDVQHIITFTATKNDEVDSAKWSTNGAGFNHSHKHGFGLLNAWRMVNAAKVWESVPYLLSYRSPALKEAVPIPFYSVNLTRTWNVTTQGLGQSGMQTLEHVSVTDWTFSTVRCWGEPALGEYKLVISDHKDLRKECTSSGTLAQWQLTLYGSSLTYRQVKERQRLVEEAMSGRYLDNSFSLPCPPGLDVAPEIVTPFSSNSLKFLLLLGCFAFFWSLYYTLEVVLAHLDLLELLGLRRSRGRRGGHSVCLQRGGRERMSGWVSVEDGEEEKEEEGEEEGEQQDSGASSRSPPLDSGVELHAVLDFETKTLLAAGEGVAT
ncbi:hypothetical protein CRUP_026418 [Coryphaenoides rupestris]|nr:hypothetical protein CRUP_026418 [Coryphaenoides rupestris]